MKNSKNIFLIILFHAVGLIGFCIPLLQPLFIQLVPYHLVLMTLLIGIGFKGDFKIFMASCLCLFLAGFWVEVLGVHTHYIFGRYHYGNTLGIKYLQVPLLMGINWFLLIFSIADIFGNSKISIPIKSIFSASLMVLIDYFIEPVAQRFDYWHWQGHSVPLQNYIAWWLISFVLFRLYFAVKIKYQQGLGWSLYLSQLTFFIILSLSTR